jgi:hypothetical protein
MSIKKRRDFQPPLQGRLPRFGAAGGVCNLLDELDQDFDLRAAQFDPALARRPIWRFTASAMA